MNRDTFNSSGMPRRFGRLSAHLLVTGVALALLAASSDRSAAVGKAPQTAATKLHGRLIFEDALKTNCYYRNQFFGTNVRANFALLDPNGNRIDPPSGNPPYVIGRFARYGATPADPNGIKADQPNGASVDVDCGVQQGGTTFNIPVDGAKLPKPNLIMKTDPPASDGIVATFKGVTVTGVPPGSTITLTDNTNGTSDSIVWLANEGKIKGGLANSATWKLPLSRGLHFAYALEENIGCTICAGWHETSIAISTDGGTVQAKSKPPATAEPSDFIRVTDHFLTYYSTELNYDIGADSKLGSCLYYQAIGAVGGCASDGSMTNQLLDFDTWRAKWGFSGEPRAVYANVADLNLQRDMHGVSTAAGTAFYVCNSPNTADFPNIKGAIKHKGLVACVAMEYAPAPQGSSPITKFITFGPTGKLLQSVNLDGKGEKFVPGACVICHGSANDLHGKGRIDETAPVDPDLQAHFLPFDLDNFVFSTKAGYTRANEEPILQQLNQYVLNTNPTDAIKELVNGWYAGGSFDGSFVPSGWSGNTDFYRGVVKPACRMCHVANNIPFNTLNGTSGFAGAIAGRVCGSDTYAAEKDRYAMPNAKATFDRFWNNEGGTGGATEAQKMLTFVNTFLGASPLTKCAPGAY